MTEKQKISMIYKNSHAKPMYLVIIILFFTCTGVTAKPQTSHSPEHFIQRDILKIEIKNYLNKIQGAYDEIEKYQSDDRLSKKNKISQEVKGLLRTGSFYVYHLWEMTQAKGWLDSQSLEYLSKNKSNYLKKGFENFLKKHEEIKILLSTLSKSIVRNSNSKDKDVEKLISRLRSFHSLKLYSSLNNNSLELQTVKNDITRVTITNVNPPYEPIDQVSFGESFRVKVTFNKDPGLDSEPITIRVKPGKLEIQTIAHRTKDPLVYLSKPLQTVHR